MRHGSLFSGIGGFDLAADWMGWTDDIWESIGEFLTERLTHNEGLMECEIVKN